jgi:hypothetical protein
VVRIISFCERLRQNRLRGWEAFIDRELEGGRIDVSSRAYTYRIVTWTTISAQSVADVCALLLLRREFRSLREASWQVQGPL